MTPQIIKLKGLFFSHIVENSGLDLDLDVDLYNCAFFHDLMHVFFDNIETSMIYPR